MPSFRSFVDSWRSGKHEHQHATLVAMVKLSISNETTGLTPNMLMLACEIRLPAEVLLFGSCEGIDEADVASYGQYVDVLGSRMQCEHEVDREHLGC